MPSNKDRGRDLSRLGMVGSPAAGAAWQGLVRTAAEPGERLESARELPIDLIEPTPDQPRKHFNQERLQSLAASIREDGVIQPILVRRHSSDPARFVIVAGERRWRASLLAGLQAIPVVITAEPDDTVTARLMLRENIEREDLDVEDLGLYLQTLADSGATQRELAALTHYSLGKVNGLLQLVKRPDLLEKVRNGLLTQEQALELISSARHSAAAPPTRTASATALSKYRPLARLATWATTFKTRSVPPDERPALRAHLQETIDRLSVLRDELGPSQPEDPGANTRPKHKP